MVCAGIVLAGDPSGLASDVYEVDPAHTEFGFVVRHLGLVNVRGRFTEYEAHVSVQDNDLSTLQLEVVMPVAGIDTGNETRDQHLRSPDFFDQDLYPELRFRSTGVVSYGAGYALVGDLTIKSTTHEVVLAGTINGPVTDSSGQTRIGIEISGEISRHDFGVTSDHPMDREIGRMVRLDVQVQAVQSETDY